MSYCASDLQTPLGLLTPNQSQRMLILGGPPLSEHRAALLGASRDEAISQLGSLLAFPANTLSVPGVLK